MLVCGGRDFNDAAMVEQVLGAVHAQRPITCLIHGAARGADTLGKLWALARGIEQTPYPADWNKHGKSAGPIRNRWMLNASHPEYVVAFPGGSGTADMAQISKDAGLPVWRL